MKLKRIAFFLGLSFILVGGMACLPALASQNQQKAIAAIKAAPAKFYQLKMLYKRDNFVLKDLSLKTGEIKKMPAKGRFLAVIKGFQGNEMASFSFQPPKEGEILTLDLPYFPLAKEIDILEKVPSVPEPELVLSVPVSAYAQGTCGDGICESFESYKTCPEDCHSGGKDGYCDHIKDGICDPDCLPYKNADPDCHYKPSSTPVSSFLPLMTVKMWILLGLTIFILLVGLGFLFRLFLPRRR